MIKPEFADSLSDIQYNQPKTIANKFVNQVASIDPSPGIKKIVVGDTEAMKILMRSSLPPEANINIQQLMGYSQTATVEKPSDSPEIAGLPPEAAALMQQMLMAQTPVQPNPEAGVGMVRKRPEYLEKAIQEVTSRNRFEADIENCSVLDLFVNLSTKQNVINTLKTISKVAYESKEQEPIFYFSDVGINFFFDENGVVNEIEMDERYRHQTTKGLKVGDSVEKAIELYGKPRMKSAKGAIWNNFSILLHDRENSIRVIRLKVRE